MLYGAGPSPIPEVRERSRCLVRSTRDGSATKHLRFLVKLAPTQRAVREASARKSVHRFGAPEHSLAATWCATKDLTYVYYGIYSVAVARSSTTSDVFNAIGEAHRREVLDTLIMGEKAVGAIVNELSLSQPQVSKHLRVLSDVGLVKCRAEGRRRFYRLDHEHLRPFHDWLEKYEQSWNARLDRMDDYLSELQRKERLQ